MIQQTTLKSFVIKIVKKNDSGLEENSSSNFYITPIQLCIINSGVPRRNLPESGYEWKKCVQLCGNYCGFIRIKIIQTNTLFVSLKI